MLIGFEVLEEMSDEESSKPSVIIRTRRFTRHADVSIEVSADTSEEAYELYKRIDEDVVRRIRDERTLNC